MSTRIPSPGAFLSVLDRLYGVALDGFPGVDSIEELVAGYASRPGTPLSRAESLVRWQIAKAATSGFITGLGGVLTMPVTIPANLASVLLVQMRMSAAVAALAGRDVRDDQVKTFVYVCLAGGAAAKLLKNAGILIGGKLTTQVIQKKVSAEALKRINQTVGFRLATKFGEKGAVNFGKMVPLVGGVIGATFDSVTTAAVGAAAIKIFHADEAVSNVAFETQPSPDQST